jgi:hypothetical protein
MPVFEPVSFVVFTGLTNFLPLTVSEAFGDDIGFLLIVPLPDILPVNFTFDAPLI